MYHNLPWPIIPEFLNLQWLFDRFLPITFLSSVSPNEPGCIRGLRWTGSASDRFFPIYPQSPGIRVRATAIFNLSAYEFKPPKWLCLVHPDQTLADEVRCNGKMREFRVVINILLQKEP